MFSIKYFVYNLAWIALYHSSSRDSSFLIHSDKYYNSLNQRILRLDTPEPWGESETYEISKTNENGDLITTVYNKNGEELYFYIKKKKNGKGNKVKNSKVRRRENYN
ncbi:conserved Plasmodium protein, unknown function [Plasmodium relictum]|uniref:Uncharacterized protein n=1 Tax=Plasmodium relictum TaxID=85471 RepID=A0A1J1H5F7_PLARL|nr:conserved Plasmodium protein, unknown function [Plasmodium relictum]CRG98652.1 conserved Plasmodium protein, unknown function [Plasmodium relictum]